MGQWDCGCGDQFDDCLYHIHWTWYTCRQDAYDATEGDYTGYYREYFLKACWESFIIGREICALQNNYCLKYCKYA